MSRELLEECGLFVSCASDFTREQRLELLDKIKSELAKPADEVDRPLDEPSFWVLQQYDGEVKTTTSKEQADAWFSYEEGIVTGYFESRQHIAPVRLSDEKINLIWSNMMDEYRKNHNDQSGRWPIRAFAKDIEQAVLKANGIGGNE